MASRWSSSLGGGRQTASPETQRLSELRIVLLGWSGLTGKSSSGNTILGREAFQTGVTEQSEKSQGDVAGRQVTVVDTPGWRWTDSVQESPECVKQEIVRSVSLCPPGPHALLLAIPVWSYSFTERERRSAQEHLELLSERVWRHTIVLFTWGDKLGDTTIEQHIERHKELQWLVEKCGNRYHVLNNRDRGDGTQVTQLLAKIQEVVAANNGSHYSSQMYQEAESRIRQRKEQILRDREERKQREEEGLREKQQKEVQNCLRRMEGELQQQEEKIRALEERIAELEERLREERNEERRRALEEELRREREQREKLEREMEALREERERERREVEERHRREMEELRRRYERQARDEAERRLDSVRQGASAEAVALGAAVGAAVGAIAGALFGPGAAAAGSAIGAVVGGARAAGRREERGGEKQRDEEEEEMEREGATLPVRRRNSKDWNPPHMSGSEDPALEEP
ncbi:GTPase IMAP family member 4 [Amia ocellicauda]|uniref:GTPase IMAP family member 4 n=1 Tax=Amia ocellicauda TaxID=2972642 RepID=UPI003464DAF5